MKNKITEGPIIKSLLAIMIPIIFANILQTAYNLIDTFWVGRLGTDAVAAVSISFPVIFLIIAFTSGIAMAGSILISQYKGRKDEKNMSDVAGQIMIMAVVFSILFSILGYIFAPEIIKALGAQGNVIPLGISYLKYYILGLVFVFGYMVFQQMYQGLGDPKTPMKITLISVLLNLVLDPLFIFGWKFIPAYGVAGAAIATIFTQGVAFAIGILLLIKGKNGIKLSKFHIKPNFARMKKIVNLGLPASIEQSSRAIRMILITMISAGFGTTVLAAFGVGSRIFSFIIIPALSLAISTSIVVGQNIGAGKKERAAKVSKHSQRIGFIALTLLGVVFFIFSKQIVSIFIPGVEDVINISSLFIKMIAISFGFIGVQMSILGALKGAGKTRLSMVLSGVGVIAQVVLAYALSHFTSLGYKGIWFAYPIAQVFSTLVSIIAFAKVKWYDHEVI